MSCISTQSGHYSAVCLACSLSHCSHLSPQLMTPQARWKLAQMDPQCALRRSWYFFYVQVWLAYYLWPSLPLEHSKLSMEGLTHRYLNQNNMDIKDQHFLIKICRHRSRSTLLQVVACYLMAQSHYQCWLINLLLVHLWNSSLKR